MLIIIFIAKVMADNMFSCLRLPLAVSSVPKIYVIDIGINPNIRMRNTFDEASVWLVYKNVIISLLQHDKVMAMPLTNANTHTNTDLVIEPIFSLFFSILA